MPSTFAASGVCRPVAESSLDLLRRESCGPAPVGNAAGGSASAWGVGLQDLACILLIQRKFQNSDRASVVVFAS